MLIQIENMRGNASPRGVGTNVPAFTRLGQLPRNLSSACRAAFLDICAVVVWMVLGILFLCSGAAAIGAFLFLAFFCKF